jgi:hypothetical protein
MLEKREQEIVRFNDFSSGVTCCFLYKGTQDFVNTRLTSKQTSHCLFSILCVDFILQTKSLFEELDLSDRGGN